MAIAREQRGIVCVDRGKAATEAVDYPSAWCVYARALLRAVERHQPIDDSAGCGVDALHGFFQLVAGTAQLMSAFPQARVMASLADCSEKFGVPIKYEYRRLIRLYCSISPDGISDGAFPARNRCVAAWASLAVLASPAHGRLHRVNAAVIVQAAITSRSAVADRVDKRMKCDRFWLRQASKPAHAC